jgi:hypothetical protein
MAPRGEATGPEVRDKLKAAHTELDRGLQA